MARLSMMSIFGGLLVVWIVQKIWTAFYNYWLHPLARFPGPKTAATTSWYRTWHQVLRSTNWIDVVAGLHEVYGEIVRVGPNELHFSNPEAYHEIYNPANRWDKEASLYRSFGEDRSSFGFLTYRESKGRKDVLAPLFSKRAISELQALVQKNMDRLCKALETEDTAGKASDMLFGLRCFTLDTITGYCFAQDVGAIEATNFQAPIVVAMEAALFAFPVFRDFSLIRRMVFSFPGWLTKLTNPALAGLVDLQERLGRQVNEVVRRPESLTLAPHPIIYHRLLDRDVNRPAGLPSAGSLYEEAQALLFGGAESAANTTMFGLFYVAQNSAIRARLQTELRSAWPDPHTPPSFEELEKLPYLTAIIKESLRLAPGVVAPYPRIVPSSGAVISKQDIPAGTVVGMSPIFVHTSANIFQDAGKFVPERWMASDATSLEKWLVAFSRGPRSCMGQNLAMCELYISFATLFRRFDIELDNATEDSLRWKECFLPAFTGRHLHAFCRPAKS